MTRLALLSFAAFFLAGCQKPEEIRHYEVTLTEPRAPAKPANLPDGDTTPPAGHPPIDKSAGGVTDAGGATSSEKTMLAALVPVGQQGWTFKVTGPVEALDKFAETFETFVQSVTFPGDTPKWKLPAGWKEVAGGGQFRFATIRVASDDKEIPPLEVAVSQVTLTADYLLDNVNRWRDQMSLAKITVAELPQETKTLSLPDKLAATLVKVTGKPKAGGMGRPPFAPGGGNGQ